MTNENETTFWLVWNPASPKTPRYRHASRESADIEAFRLAREHPDQAFYVMEWVGGTFLKQLKPQEPDNGIPF